MGTPWRRAAVDAEAAGGFLADRYGEVDGVEPFSRGEWSRAFAFRTGGRELVVRFGEFAADYEKERVAASWRDERLPVPPVLEIGSAFGGAYAVSERAFGTPLEEVGAEQWQALLPALLDAMAAMREVRIGGAGYGDWRPGGAAPGASWAAWLLDIAGDAEGSKVAGWRERLRSVPGAEERFAHCHRALQRAAGGVHAGVRSVVHADLTAGNVLVEGDRITAVFDWANSLAGDPLYDVGWLAFWGPWHPGIDVDELRARVRARFDDGDFDRRVRCCALHVGLDAQRYCAWAQRWDELRNVGFRTLDFIDANG